MILIYPPCTKPSEPPPGIARLCGALRHHGIDVMAVDMNVEGFFYLHDRPIEAVDRWSRRALSKKDRNLELIRSAKGYENRDRYAGAVADITRILELASPAETRVSLANYQQEHLSPVKSRDLLNAAEQPETNAFFPYFDARFKSLAGKGRNLGTVGFSLNFLNQALTTFAMIGHVKRHYPETRIIVGGGLVTSWMRNPLWSNPFAHLAEWVAGDGEGPLLARFGIEQTQAWYCPDYRDFMDNDYLSPGRVLPFCTSGGCYWRKCRFCPETVEKNPYHAMAVPTVMDQLDDLFEFVGPGLIHLVDNALSPSLLKAMNDRKVKTPWYGFARMTPQLADPDLCRSLKQSGCVMLKLGLESGDVNVLRQMNKGVDLALASRVLDQLHRAGIATYVYLLFGTPAEDEAAAEKTMTFVVNHSEKIGFLNIAVFNLPYFADEAETLETRLFYDGDLSLYREFTHPLGWERPLIRRFLDKQFKKHPRIAAIVHRDPPVFGSNHAPFFCMS